MKTQLSDEASLMQVLSNGKKKRGIANKNIAFQLISDVNFYHINGVIICFYNKKPTIHSR